MEAPHFFNILGTDYPEMQCHYSIEWNPQQHPCVNLRTYVEVGKYVILICKPSTYFEHKDIHKGTWKDPAGRTVNEIDRVLINKRRATIVEDMKTMRGANCDSDCFLHRIKIRHRIACIYQKKKKYKIRWDIHRLENKDTKNEYQEYIAES